MRIAAHSVVVEFRMLARPLLTCCSPQAIRTQGRSALVIAMMMNGTIRALQKLPNSGRPVIRMITASVSAPEADLTRTRTVGLMSRMPSLMKRNDAPLFFFQAEDGIRDLTVTGVQTCALPI